MNVSKLKTMTASTVIYYLMVVFALTLPLSRAAVSGLPVLLLLVWMFQMVKDKKYNEYLNIIVEIRPLLIFIIFSTFALFSLFWSDMSGGEYRSIYKLFFYVLVIPIVMVTSLTNKEKSTVLTAFLVGMFISEILSYGIFFEFFETNTSRKYDYPVPFMSHIQYSTFLALAATLLLIKVFNTETWKTRLFYVLYLSMVVGNLFISGGRTGQLAFISAVFVVSLMRFKHKVRTFFITVSVLFAVLFIAYSSVDTFKHRIDCAKSDLIKVYEKQQFCTSFGIRLGSYELAYELMKEAPITGHGIFGHNSALYNLIDIKYPERSCIKNHTDMQNQFLLVLVQFGLIGLFLYLSFFWSLLKYKNSSVEFDKLKYIFIVVFFVFFISEGLIYQFSNALFGFLLALSLEGRTTKNIT